MKTKMNDYLKAPQAAPQMKNFAMQQMSHMGMNPIHEEHIQKALALHPAKIPPVQAPQPNNTMGSPWLTMGVKK